jgi:hypothetical protein
VCTVAKQKARNLGPVRDALCPDIEKELPQVQLVPNCKTAVEAVWDEVNSVCLPSEGGDEAALGNQMEAIATLCKHHEPVKVTKAVTIICQDLKQNASIAFKPSCETVLMDVWKLMESKCPSALAAPNSVSPLTKSAPVEAGVPISAKQHQATDEEVKLICNDVNWAQVRARDIEGVCFSINKKISAGLIKATFEPDCQTYLDTIWDDALEECPHGSETILLSVQSIENVICKTATGQVLQSPDTNSAIADLCATVMRERPYFKFYPDNTAADCHTAMQGAWEIAKSKCPNGASTTPSQQDYQKLICSFATKAQLDGEDYDGTCSKITESIQWIKFDPDCVTALQRVWRHASAKCPLGSDKVPTPFEIEMLMCSSARRKEMQDMRTIEICSEISLTTPWILRNFDPDCHSVFDVVWDDAVLKCPAGRDTVLDDQQFIYWACGHTLAEWIQHRSYDRICDTLLFEVPWLQNTVSPNFCPHKVANLFEDMRRVCPLGRATPQTSDLVKFTVCSFATAEQVAKHDTVHVCELMKARVPWLQYRGSCHTAVDQEWAAIEEVCPAGAYGPIKGFRRVGDEANLLALLPDVKDGTMQQAPY